MKEKVNNQVLFDKVDALSAVREVLKNFQASNDQVFSSRISTSLQQANSTYLPLV